MAAGEEQAFAIIINQTYARMRLEGTLPAFITDWTVEDVRNFPGDKWVHPDTGAIVGNAVSSIQLLRGENWQVFHILGVSDSVAVRDRNEMSLKVLKGTVIDSFNRGAVGAMCTISTNATALRAFLESWPTAVIEVEGSFVRAWMRHQPGLPEWEKRVKGNN